MSVGRFIAGRISGRGENSLSGRNNTLACVSVCLSVAIMIIAVAVVAGFKSRIRERVSGVMGSVMLVAPGQAPVNELYPFKSNLSYIPRIEALPEVESVCGTAYRSGLIRAGGQIEGLYFKGVDSLYDFRFFRDCLVDGEMPDFRGRISSEVMISELTASKLGLKAGDDMAVYFIGDDVKVRKFHISGLYNAQLEELDSRMALCDIRQVQRLNGWEKDEVSSVEIRCTPRADIDFLHKQVEEIEFLNVSENDTALFVTDVRSVFGHLFDWLSLLDLNVVMILSLLMLVAGFNMISAVLIILFEKISMIGLLKALGMTGRDIGKVFLLRSLSIVGKGMILGNIFGLGLCLVQKYTEVIRLDPASYFVDCVPIEIDFASILLLDVISLAVIMAIVSLSTLFISRVSPDRTMRME